MTAWTADLTSLVAAGRTFGTIYADPPWPYKDQGTRGAAAKHYPPLPLDALQALPVSALAAKDAHLHLWTTSPFLDTGIDLLRVWGFTYTATFVWNKEAMGQGHYWRIQTEFLLLGVRGQAPTFRRHDLRNVLRLKGGEHSRKPDIVRYWIEQASPGPYLELFGRELVDGWTVFGNEIRSLVPGSTTQPRCAWCGEPFSPRRRSGKYCADACKQAAYRQRYANRDPMARVRVTA